MAPGLATLPATLQTALLDSDATCLLGPRTNLVTKELSLQVPLGPNLKGLDTRVVRVESLPPGRTRPVQNGGATAHWAETLEGTAKIRIQAADGAAVLVHAGALHYLSSWPDQVLWDQIIEALAGDCGLLLETLPDGLCLRDTASHRFAFNYSPVDVEWQGRIFAPAEVAWWETKSN